MAILNLPAFMVPEPRTCVTAPTSFRSILIDAAGESGAVITKVPKTGTISKVGLRSGAITLMTNPLKVGIQTVDATTGFPTGTAYGSMVAGTGTPVANTFTWYTLSTGATATIGDNIAIVAEFNSFAAGDSMNLNMGLTRDPSANSWPYVAAFQGGAWADQSYPPNIAIEYSDGSIVELSGITPYSNVTEEIFSSASNPNKRGVRFRFPVSVEVSGIWAYVRHDADMDFVLYDSDGASLLRYVSLDKDIRAGTTSNVSAPFAPVTLSANTYYYAVAVPTTVSSIRLYSFDVLNDGSSTTMDAEPIGDEFHMATVNGTPTGTGDWTTTLTSRYHMGVMVSGFNAGGGLLTHPGMNGGMRG